MIEITQWEIRAFLLRQDQTKDGYILPLGWEPFAIEPVGQRGTIVYGRHEAKR